MKCSTSDCKKKLKLIQQTTQKCKCGGCYCNKCWKTHQAGNLCNFDHKNENKRNLEEVMEDANFQKMNKI